MFVEYIIFVGWNFYSTYSSDSKPGCICLRWSRCRWEGNFSNGILWCRFSQICVAVIVQLAVWWAVSPEILVTVIKGSNAPLDMAFCSLVVATNI